jgi:hypothetical protein
MVRSITMQCEENCDPCMLEMKNIPEGWSCKLLDKAKKEGETHEANTNK